MSRSEKIQVALRLRPSDPASVVWSWTDQSMYLCELQRQKLLEAKLLAAGTATSFQFDHCFGTEAGNEAVYSLLIRSIVQSCRFGFSGSVLAYGQTGSGKSYLMSGGEGTQGLVHFALKDLVEELTGEVSCALFELYNEQVFDLLQTAKLPLKVKEDPERGFFIHNLSEVPVQSLEDVTSLLDLGERRRHYAATKLNHHSSRAHHILKVTIRTTERLAGVCKVTNSTLHFVDLAGSERLSLFKEASEELACESRHINRSLFYLCQVISKLSEAGPITHVPYRNSALTKILRSALGGSARTAIVCTAVPTLSHFDMTLSTLRFGAKARCIDNEVVADTYEEVCEMDSSAEEVEKLREELLRITIDRRLKSTVALDIEPVLTTEIVPVALATKEETTSTSDLPDIHLCALQTALRCSQSHNHSLHASLLALQARHQAALNSLKSLSQRYVLSTQRRFKAQISAVSRERNQANRHLQMVLYGDYIECLSNADLRKLEMCLFTTIDRIKVEGRQETRIRRECTQESLDSTSSSEGSEGREDCGADKETGDFSGYHFS